MLEDPSARCNGRVSLDVPELVLHKGAQLVHLQSKPGDVEHDGLGSHASAESTRSGKDVDALCMAFQLHRALHKLLDSDVTTLQTQGTFSRTRLN